MPPPRVEELKIKEETRKDEPKKRKRKLENEIDELFDAALGRKVKKAALAVPVSEEKEGVVVKGEKEVNQEEEDKSLKAVLGAIRSAPKGEEKHRKKRKKV